MTAMKVWDLWWRPTRLIWRGHGSDDVSLYLEGDDAESLMDHHHYVLSDVDWDTEDVTLLGMPTADGES